MSYPESMMQNQIEGAISENERLLEEIERLRAEVERLKAAAVPDGFRSVIERAVANLTIFNERPRPMCRDCADCDGICTNGGLDCDVPALIAQLRSMLAAAPQPPTAQEEKANGPSHSWDVDGSHCIKCGDPDWCADKFCSESKLPPSEPKP